MTRKYATPLALSISLASSFSLASENNVTPETVVVSADRIEKQLNAQSIAMSVIDQDDIENIGHTHISQLLNQVPGVTISRGNGQENLTAIRSGVLTGTGSCGAFYFSEDGIPLRGPGFCNVNELFDVNAEQAARIEVIRGPGTAVHGTNALNGVINVISQSPSDTPESHLSLEAGPDGYGRLKASHSDTNGQHAYRISAQGSHDDGYKDDSGYAQQKLNIRHDYDGQTWSIQSMLAASNLNQETAGYILGKDAYKVSSRKRENPNPEAFRNSSSVRYYSRFERDGERDSRFVVTPYLRYTEMEFLQHFLPGTPLEENGERTIGLQSAFYQNYSKNVTLYNGFDMEATKAYLQQYQAQASFTSFPTGQHYDYEVDALYGAWFIGGDWQASSRTKVNFGGRYDLQFYDYNNLMIDGNTAADGSACPSGTCRYARPADDKEHFRNSSFNLGVIQQISEHTDLTANAAHGFRAPQAAELYRLQAQQLNANLSEESLNSLEIGLRGTWNAFQYRVSTYWMHKHDVIIQDSNRNNINGGKTIDRGIEANFHWQLTPTLLWQLQASYSKHQYANNALTAEGNEIDTAPRQLAGTVVRWTPLTNTQIELEIQHQGEYYLEENNLHTYPGHTLSNIRWRQQYNKQLYSVLRITNLTDINYAERADYAFGNYRYFVGEPRAAYLELGIDF
ncbi:Vitamin B12 transporter BtuB [Zhongshania aliphaticivorans]|uniref:Vitamin B12 transporter BtuB n=1 Tax=Zhongshania aliphaticivorans TaxID=1470434 RepID=A0A5S9Q9S2_9GAMM|nr:TonB-dependent receptor [Zhongshania aliphaticivorans]CAA0087418.1 Vitamin B12 transporter BtuB [Zhongshania aliphaticivorans]CAA0114818.1 Vitamin B12 transporter BtuB [Zhongshania aliphaticivorans]